MAIKLLEMKTLFPDPTRQGIVDIMWRNGAEIFNDMPFIEHNAMVYPYSKESQLPGVAYRALNEEFASTNEGVTLPDVESLAILGGDVVTDSVLIAQKGIGPARANRLAKKVKSATRRFVRDFFKGDRKTNPKSFYGLEARLGAARIITNATNGAVPNHKKFVEMMDLVEGPNAEKRLYLNVTTRRLLSEDVAANAGGMGIFDVGKQLTNFNGSPIVEVGKDEAETEILAFDETCGNSAVTASAYCVKWGSDTDEEYVQGILGLPDRVQFIDVGYTGATYKDVVQMVAGFGMFSGYCAARLKGLKAA